MNTATTPDDARTTLLRCALALLVEGGHEALSVRRVAERAGVSSGAPYYHFADRRALLVGLACDGFDRLETLARSVLTQDDLTPAERLLALSSAFLDFGAAEPQLMDLMYESELTRPIDPALEPFYRRAFDMVVGVVRAVHPDADRTVMLTRALTFWTSLFGLSRLLRQQLLAPFDGEIDGHWRDVILVEIVATAVSA